MNKNIIHVGMHKTGSTFLQKQLFPFVLDKEFLSSNYEFEKFLRDQFLNCLDGIYKRDEFLKTFYEKFQRKTSTSFIISEENLSGHIYSGVNWNINAQRLFDCFPDSMIIIVLRNQNDLIFSTWSNYRKYGGLRKFEDWLVSEWTLWGVIKQKLEFDNFVRGYCQLFGRQNVKIFFFEELFKNGFDQLIADLELDTKVVPDIKKVVNPGFGKNLVRAFSVLDFYSRGFLSTKYRSMNRRNSLHCIPQDWVNCWAESNRRLSDFVRRDLPEEYL